MADKPKTTFTPKSPQKEPEKIKSDNQAVVDVSANLATVNKDKQLFKQSKSGTHSIFPRYSVFDEPPTNLRYPKF
jgi:hypothetical protein